MRADWQTIVQRLAEKGWSLGWNRFRTTAGRLLWSVDARCGDGRRFIAQAEEMTAAFLELEKLLSEHSHDAGSPAC